MNATSAGPSPDALALPLPPRAAPRRSEAPRSPRPLTPRPRLRPPRPCALPDPRFDVASRATFSALRCGNGHWRAKGTAHAISRNQPWSLNTHARRLEPPSLPPSPPGGRGGADVRWVCRTGQIAQRRGSSGRAGARGHWCGRAYPTLLRLCFADEPRYQHRPGPAPTMRRAATSPDER